MKKLFVLIVAILTVSSAFAAVEFTVGPGFNSFGDTRISGINNSFCFSYDVGDLKAGYLTEQSNLTLTDETNSANNWLLLAQMSAIRVSKPVSSVAGSPVSAGLELGSVVTTGRIGTAALPGGQNQVVPLVGIFGSIEYNSTGRDIKTRLIASLGYRFIDINDVPLPFGGATRAITNLNGITISLGVGIEF